MSKEGLIFNPPPGWPKPPSDWVPPAGWTPDPSWPNAPEGWQLWVPKRSSESKQEDSAHGDGDQTSQPQSAIDGSSVGESDNLSRLRILEAENAALRQQLSNKGEDSDELVVLDDERVLQSVGIYRYHHPLENAAAYKARLDDLGSQITELVKVGNAIEKSNMFTFDNSLAKGRRMTTDLGKLMLRAYNAESDNSIRSLRVGNVVTAKKRLEASRAAIAKLGAMMEMRISDRFHELRLEEIELTADWLMRKQAEKEEAREERARLREEKRVEKELAKERERLDKERSHIENAIAALLQSGLDGDPELEARLAAIDSAIEENDFRIANIRAGYVYVISNPGAFGPNIVKIGLTRRLEPLDRIRELSGASVPFQFDIHALYFSEDAVSLETELHHYFAGRAVNMANKKKEFFFATPIEVREALIEKVGNLLEFTEKAEATEYLQSVRYWPDEAKRQ
ncbi:DUF4041 domain-containing protein [Pseudomonadota bacterium]